MKECNLPQVMASSISNIKVGSKQWRKAIVKNSYSAIYEIRNRTDNEEINTLTEWLINYIKEYEFYLKQNKN